MICFICKQQISELQALVVHYKCIHLLKSSSTYQCTEQQCTQLFPNLSSFKKHLARKHSITSHKPSNSNMLYLNEPQNDDFQIHNDDNIIPQIDETYDEIFNKNQSLPQENHNSFDLITAINRIHTSAVHFTISLLSNNNFSRKDSFNIQREIENILIQPIIDLLDSFTKDKIKDPLILSSFHQITQALSKPFEFCNTEYNLNKWLSDNNMFHQIQQFTINEEINLVSVSGETVYNDNNIKGIILPLQFQFKTFFETNNNLNKTLSHYSDLMNDKNASLRNFIQGSLWKDKIAQYQNKIVVPYFMYIDDFELNNPLGSHASFHSLSAIYYSFPLSDQSKLSNIHLAALIKTVDMKDFGNDLCLKKLIQELNILETNGIYINTQDGFKEVHFILGLFLGDNLALNSVSEFSKSFSANFFCRFCKAHKSKTHKLCEEDSLLLRNHTNYLEDIERNDFKETGIYKNSILNNIASFHVVKNYSIDIMHDIFEGICHYNMCHIINYYIGVANFFTLDILNFRKQHFNYGCIEFGNISPPIQMSHLKKFHLKMSAREMMTFVYYFSLMVGDLVPEDDEVWKFFLIFLEIIEILLSGQFTQSIVFHLKILIKKHNSDYIILFKDTLKPKHHLLIHYPMIILNSGPPRNFWCFRYESKHKEMKIYAHAITSRKNISLTLAKKFQYKFINNILLNSFGNIEYEVKSKHNINSRNNELIQRNLGLSLDDFNCYSQIKLKGTTYKVGYFVTKFIDELCLFEILDILLIKKNCSFKFIVSQLQIHNYNSHLRAYQVDNNDINLKNILNPEGCSGPPININITYNGNSMIRLKEYY